MFRGFSIVIVTLLMIACSGDARAAKRAVKSNGWGVPGLSWIPGEVPDPFGH